VDQEGARMSVEAQMPVLAARGLVKTYGRIVGLDGADFDLMPGEILAVIGDNGAGKSTLIKCLTGAERPDSGTLELSGERVEFRGPQDARAAGIETVYQSLAVAPALDIGTLQNMSQSVDTLSGGQRQAVSVARAAAFAKKVIFLDEPTAALGVKESNSVLDLILRLRDNGLPVVLISHNMPQVFQVADRIHIQRLGKRVAVVTPQSHSMTDAVAIMTGAATIDRA
jgi:fructose transport system ATP-binding protein